MARRAVKVVGTTIATVLVAGAQAYTIIRGELAVADQGTQCTTVLSYFQAQHLACMTREAQHVCDGTHRPIGDPSLGK